MRFAEVLGLALVVLQSCCLQAQPSPGSGFLPSLPLLGTQEEKTARHFTIPEVFQKPANSDPDRFSREVLQGTSSFPAPTNVDGLAQPRQPDEGLQKVGELVAPPEPGVEPSTTRLSVTTQLPAWVPVEVLAPGTRPPTAARIVARVNGVPILDADVQVGAAAALLGARDEAEKAKILNASLKDVVERELVLQHGEGRLRAAGQMRLLEKVYVAADREFAKQWLQPMMKANHYTDEKRFELFMHDQGCSLEMYRRCWARTFVAMQFLRSIFQPVVDRVGLLEVVAYYEKHPEEFRVEESVTWQDIFVGIHQGQQSNPTSQLARTLAKRIRKGEDFVSLAKKYDTGDSHLRDNAEGIGHKRGEIRPPCLEAVIFGLRPSEVALVEKENGFHIVKLLSHQPAGKNPLDCKVQKQILARLQSEVFSKEKKRLVTTLRSRAEIQVERFNPASGERLGSNSSP